MHLVQVSIVQPDRITPDLESRHVTYVKGTYETCEGFLHIGSLMGEAGGGVYIFSWENIESVQGFIDADPFFKEGIAEYEIVPYLIRHNRLAAD